MRVLGRMLDHNKSLLHRNQRKHLQLQGIVPLERVSGDFHENRPTQRAERFFSL
jgi:hypothetical protein